MMTRDEAAEIFRLMRQIRKIIKRGLYQNYREQPPDYRLPDDLTLEFKDGYWQHKASGYKEEA